MVSKEAFTAYVVTFGQAQQAAFKTAQTTVEAIELIHQPFDAVVVETHSLHQNDQFLLKFIVAFLQCGWRFLRVA